MKQQMELKKTYKELEEELAKISLQLEEATDSIEAIRSGQIDALIVKGENGSQIYTVKSADQTYRMFIEKMNEGALTLNIDGLILYANSRFAEMVALPLSKVIGHPFLQFVPLEYKKVFTESIHNGWQAHNKGEIIITRSDGHCIPLLFSLSTLELDEGMALNMILTDLSLQKEGEQRLKETNEQLLKANSYVERMNDELELKVKERTKDLLISRENFKFLADNIPVIAWTALPDGTINYFNQRFYEYAGVDASEFFMNDWMQVIHPEDRGKTIAQWQHAIKTGQPLDIEYRFKYAPDDSYHWHYGKGLPYKNEEGHIIAWFGTSTDIELQKKELEQKDEFISMVSHELKTPLTSLKGFTQLLMFTTKQDNNNQVDGYLETMNNQINKLTRLIADLLDITKSKAGELQFDNELFDFNELVKEVAGEMQLTTIKHTIAIKLTTTVEINGDRDRIGQVITNLISNAIKYSPAADKIIISTRIENNKIILCVQDFGIGISRLQQPNLYSRFYRVLDTSEAHTFPGMGLGLYISKNIIEKHMGKMWLESEPGKGAKFYFALMIADN
ncbi:ATP-binding protein [Ferruginibacter paludis]|uniref:PAS domain-containing sensor histidine kinase n=1 Tax=Ferruginibacter paludis TaxID=1310417 RepID=UPI0025B528C6|nr:ATP-binding protein [Ferruginibacter paludis]MDN3657918.1 ATP-binding protein [Ferruginibacter paludis]